MRRLLVATVAATSLVLAGCGSDDSAGGLDSVTVSKSAKPKVTVGKDFTATKTTSRVLNAGSGEKLASGDLVKVKYVAINGRTGKEFDNSFTSDQPLTLTLSEKSVLAGFVKGLVGKTVGSRVLVAIPPRDGFGQAQPDLGMKKDDTMVFLFDLVAKVPTEVAGKSAALPKTFPKLKLNAKGQPEAFVKTSTTASKKDAKEGSAVVIEGDGPVVTAEQTVTVQYFGQVYPGGSTFDESYSKGVPLSRPLSGLIKCWADELVGKKVGSRVVLVCPADVAYGDAGSPPSIKGGDTLLFAVDLLDAS